MEGYYNKEYYLYMDEGGIFGNCSIEISENKLIEKDNNDISLYYFGLLPIHSIRRILQHFTERFPKCKIIYTKQSIIKDLDLKEYGM